MGKLNTTVDFGTFPGSVHVKKTVTGCSGILTTSDVEAYITPVSTADHSVDEHNVVDIQVKADKSSIVNNTSVDVHCTAPDNPAGGGPHADGIRLHGLWTICVCWN